MESLFVFQGVKETQLRSHSHSELISWSDADTVKKCSSCLVLTWDTLLSWDDYVPPGPMTFPEHSIWNWVYSRDVTLFFSQYCLLTLLSDASTCKRHFLVILSCLDFWKKLLDDSIHRCPTCLLFEWVVTYAQWWKRYSIVACYLLVCAWPGTPGFILLGEMIARDYVDFDSRPVGIGNARLYAWYVPVGRVLHDLRFASARVSRSFQRQSA